MTYICVNSVELPLLKLLTDIKSTIGKELSSITKVLKKTNRKLVNSRKLAINFVGKNLTKIKANIPEINLLSEAGLIDIVARFFAIESLKRSVCSISMRDVFRAIRKELLENYGTDFF